MANIIQNRIDAVLDPSTVAKIRDYIIDAISMLPEQGNISLNDDERYNLASIDVDNKAFVEDVISVMKHSGTTVLPGYINANMVETDLILFTQMDDIFGYIEDFRRRVMDLRRLSASEAMNVSNKVLGLYQSAADSAVPGAQAGYDKMKERYKNNGGGNPQKPLEQ